MENSTDTIDYRSDPKFIFLNNLSRECYEDNANHSTIVNKEYNENDTWCKRIFDGISCWDETPALTTASQQCPAFVTGFDPKLTVYKECAENGTWLVNPETNQTWTNYSTCIDFEDLEFRSWVNNIYVTGYSISAVALLLSIMIFLYFRVLHCMRIRIHVQLFAAFFVNNLLWVLWYKTVVNQAVVIQENKIWCQVLHVLTNLSMVTTYFWMFVEGLHLHLALVVVFVRDELAMRWFMAVGWGLSVVIILVYAIVRYLSGDTQRCWIDNSNAFWIINVPVALTLLSSLVFMVNVVRVLVRKVHRAPNQPISVALRKGARAALILIPLFGLHFILIPLRPLPNSPWEKTYQVVSSLLISLQGLCVAILFCFTNDDVTVVINAYRARHRRNNEDIPMTGATAGESLNTRDHPNPN